MEKLLKSSPRKKKMAARKLEVQNTNTIESIIEKLQSRAAISERELLGYLNVSEKTLRNWKSTESFDSSSSKLTRLKNLDEVVDVAIKRSIPKSYVKEFLAKRFESESPESQSIVDVIQDDPPAKLFHSLVVLAVDKFSNEIAVPQEIRLSAEEYENLLQLSSSNPEPNERLRAARKRYLSLKK